MSALTEPAVVVPERGTGLRRAAVVTAAAPGRFDWIRWPGPDAPVGFTAVPPALTAALPELRTAAGSRVLLGEPWHGARRYTMARPRSVAEELIAARGRDCDAFAGAVRELGRLVRRLHRVPALQAAQEPPPALQRLGAWLDGAPFGPRHAAVRDVVRTRLGGQRWALLSSWHAELLDGGGAAVLAHGWLGLGQCAAGAAPGTVELVVGEDVGLAPWYADVGWVAGQILELRHFLGTAGNRAQFGRLLEAWFEGYGCTPDHRVHQAAVLDIALHVHDFSAYFTYGDEEPAAWAELLAGLLDEPPW